MTTQGDISKRTRKPGDGLLGPGAVLLVLGVVLVIATPGLFSAGVLAVGVLLGLIGNAVNWKSRVN